MGEDQLPDVGRLAIGKFDSTVYLHTVSFLRTLKQYYINKASRASAEKEAKVTSMTTALGGTAPFNEWRNRYVSEAVSNAVKNMSSADRIVEYQGRLIQKIFPIYVDEHRSLQFLDFSASLYQPTKHFAGAHFDTLYFNIAVMWSMTVFLFITLYFDILKRFIKLLEGNRKYRRKERH